MDVRAHEQALSEEQVQRNSAARLQEELKHQAFHDTLSGLANRALLRDRLEHALVRAARSGAALAVLFLDLDDFKLVNDTLGHAAGDELLVAVAERLTNSLRSGDTAARFGGDEFAILLEDIESAEAAQEVAQRIVQELRVPVALEGRDVRARASVGIALSSHRDQDATELMQAADVAMYSAKTRGKDRFVVYEPALQDEIVNKLEKTAELQRAIEEREFVLYYQPIFTIEGDKPVGLEALARWRHPERGLLPPKEFIPLAEETGLIVPLSRWVLQEACRQARDWQLRHAGAERLWVSVNISARHFQRETLWDDISVAASNASFDPRGLVLEITEGVFVKDTESVVARMLELKALGVQFAVDDFGTGYSSLGYLLRFPVDILKLDKSFVDGIGKSKKMSAVAECIVTLGSTLGLRTVAEGIEHLSQAQALRSFGCEYGQGFYLAKPQPADEVERLLRGVPRAGGPTAATASMSTGPAGQPSAFVAS